MAISVRSLSKSYNGIPAIDQISFEVKTGEILGFLGPNGAGKTTTMKIISRFLEPDAGSVEIDGYNIQEHSLEIRRKIGYLPENNPLYEDMNVVDFIRYAGELYGLRNPYLNQRVKLMLEVCGIGDIRHKDIGELSKGYKQRVGLAQAMIHDPDILILDEPTSGLDPNQIIEIRNLIKRLGASKTVILSTHILSEAQATSDRVAIINKGKIVADGKVEELQDQFRGSEILFLEIKAAGVDPMLDVYPKLKEIENVENVEFVESQNDSHKFKISSPKGRDMREIAFDLAVSQNWKILEMSRRVVSLEEVFRKLTTESDERLNLYGEESVSEKPPIADENAEIDSENRSDYAPKE